MIISIGDVYAQIPQHAAIEDAMLAAQSAARRQDGCVSYAFAETIDEPGHYIVVQSWRDQEALDAHYRSDDFAAYQSAIAPLLVRHSELRTYLVGEAMRFAESSLIKTDQDD